MDSCHICDQDNCKYYCQNTLNYCDVYLCKLCYTRYKMYKCPTCNGCITPLNYNYDIFEKYI